MPRSQQRHECVFPIDEELAFDLDGKYAYASIQCEHREILDSYSGGEFEDTYYEEGPRCEAVKNIRASVSEPYGAESGVVVTYSENQDRWNEILDALEDAIEEAMSMFFVPHQPKTELTVTTEGFEPEEYRIDLEVEEESIDR